MRIIRSTSQPKFRLQFAKHDIKIFARKYERKNDKEALDSGKSIAHGEYSRRNLEIIFEWKTRGRGRTRISKNTDKEIYDALKLACTAKSDRSAIAVLCGLNGVDIPVASSILTCINPKRFTIIDFRALESLGVSSKNTSLNFYLEYLKYCRRLAHSAAVDLRTLDRALWQWSSENS